MALQGGHRFAVSMDEVFPAGVYAVDVRQAEEFVEKNGRRSTQPAKDAQSGVLVWTVTCMDRDPQARSREVKVKVSAPVMPSMPAEVMPGSGLACVEFTGLTITPYIEEPRGGNGRARMAYSYRATGMFEQGKAPRQQPAAPASGSGAAARASSGDGKAA